MLTFKEIGERRREWRAQQEERELRKKHAKRKQMLAAEAAKLSPPCLRFEWTGECTSSFL